MACRAVSVSTGGARSPVGAGAVEPSERVTAATVGTVGAPVAAGCEAGGATKIARLAREPREEGGVAALLRREGCGGGTFLGFYGGHACLVLL